MVIAMSMAWSPVSDLYGASARRTWESERTATVRYGPHLSRACGPAGHLRAFVFAPHSVVERQSESDDA